MLSLVQPPQGATPPSNPALPEQEEACPICLEKEPLDDSLEGRVVALPCHHTHLGHLSCIIKSYAQPRSESQNCAICRREYDIIDPVIFAHLLPQEGEDVETRRMRICQEFNTFPPSIFSRSDDDLIAQISMLLCGDPHLFSGSASEGSPRAELKQLIGNPRTIQSQTERRQHLEELCLQAFYVERLPGETNKSYHARMNVFAKREARTSQEGGNAERMLAQAVQLNNNQPFNRRHPRDGILPPGVQPPRPLPRPRPQLQDDDNDFFNLLYNMPPLDPPPIRPLYDDRPYAPRPNVQAENRPITICRVITGVAKCIGYALLAICVIVGWLALTIIKFIGALLLCTLDVLRCTISLLFCANRRRY